MHITTKIKLVDNYVIVIDSSVEVNGRQYAARMQHINRDAFRLSTSAGGCRCIIGVHAQDQEYVDAMVDHNIRDLMRYIGNQAKRKVEFVK